MRLHAHISLFVCVRARIKLHASKNGLPCVRIHVSYKNTHTERAPRRVRQRPNTHTQTSYSSIGTERHHQRSVASIITDAHAARLCSRLHDDLVFMPWCVCVCASHTTLDRKIHTSHARTSRHDRDILTNGWLFHTPHAVFAYSPVHMSVSTQADSTRGVMRIHFKCFLNLTVTSSRTSPRNDRKTCDITSSRPSAAMTLIVKIVVAKPRKRVHTHVHQTAVALF